MKLATTNEVTVLSRGREGANAANLLVVFDISKRVPEQRILLVKFNIFTVREQQHIDLRDCQAESAKNVN